MAEDDGRIGVVRRRAKILAELNRETLHKRDLIDQLDLSRSTIDRSIDELSNAGLCQRVNGGYEITLTGRLVLSRYRAYVDEMESTFEAQPVLDVLPKDANLDTAPLVEADIHVAEGSAPYQPLESLHEEIRSADHYRGILPVLEDPRHIRLLYEHVVVDSQQAELVVGPTLLATLREKFTRRFELLERSEHFELYVGDTPAFGLVLTKDASATTASLVVFGSRGSVHGVVQNDNRAAVSWAEDVFERHVLEAELATTNSTASGGAANYIPNLSSVDRSLPPELEADGFVQLSTEYFQERPTTDPITAWRTGLNLSEVYAGYAIDRTREAEGDQQSLVDQLTERLHSSGSVALIGPPGCGKSTICKQIACQWYMDERGTVFYRESGRGRSFDEVETLLDTIEAAEGHVLLVVEDAVRPAARGIFDAARGLVNRDDVAILVDVRRDEWEDPPGEQLDSAAEQVRTDDFEPVSMPQLSDQDCKALIERIWRTIDSNADMATESICDEIRQKPRTNGAEPGDILLLLHRAVSHVGSIDDRPTTLEADARSVLEDLLDAGNEVVDVGITVNLLNAAGFEVDPGLVGSLTSCHDEARIREGLGLLDGRVLFERTKSTENQAFRTIHETWSVAFLAELIEKVEDAENRVDRCMTALLALADSADARQSARRGVNLNGDASPSLSSIADAPGDWADEAVERLFTLGVRYPKLAPLFGDSDSGDPVGDLPSACSNEIVHRRLKWFGRMNSLWGDFETAEQAYERLRERTSNSALAGPDEQLAQLHVEATLKLADVLDQWGDSGQFVKELIEEGLAKARDIDDDHLVAIARLQRGRITRKQGDPAAATEEFETALEFARSTGARLTEIDALLELGYTATVQHEHENAIERKKEGLKLAREIGVKERENRAAGDLGMDYYDTGNVDEAANWWRRSLALAREIGDREAIASEIQNLGMAELRRGRYDAAREKFEDGHELALEVETDGCAPLLNLAKTHRHMENLDEAERYAQEGIECCRDVGWKRGRLAGETTLASISRDRGDLEAAASRARENVSVSQEINDPGFEISNRRLLGAIARERGDFEEAERQLDEGYSLATDIDAGYAIAGIDLEFGRLHRARGDLTRARERFNDAVEQYLKTGAVRDALTAIEEIVDVLETLGEQQAASEQCKRGLELASESGFDDELESFRERRNELAPARD